MLRNSPELVDSLEPINSPEQMNSPELVFRLDSSADAPQESGTADNEEAQQLLERINCISGIGLLCKLTRAVQKHRGASISCLHGDAAFLALRDTLERQIDKLFLLLVNHQSTHSTILQEHSKSRIMSATNDWHAIKTGWQKDSFIHNYEFHSHLIDLLNRIVRDCVKECVKEFFPQSVVHQKQQDRESIQGILMEVPENIELLAKLRGLVTHIAVTGELDEGSRLRASFLTEKTSRDYQRVYHCLNKIKGPMAEIQALHSLPVQKIRLDSFLHKVTADILQVGVKEGKATGGNIIRVDAQELFDMATEVIDIYWLLVEQGLSVLEKMQLECYLKN